MKSVLFGRHMAEKLKELHHEALAVDRNEDRVNDMLPLVTNAQTGDSTNEQLISSLAFGILTCASPPSVMISKAPRKPLHC